jgi:hypothetical protein
MTPLVAGAAAACSALLVLLTYVQVLYMEALRLRPRERPALDYFKQNIQPRIGLENDRAVLTFSLLKHTRCWDGSGGTEPRFGRSSKRSRRPGWRWLQRLTCCLTCCTGAPAGSG